MLSTFKITKITLSQKDMEIMLCDNYRLYVYFENNLGRKKTNQHILYDKYLYIK